MAATEDADSLARRLQRERDGAQLYHATHGTLFGAVVRGDVAALAALFEQGAAAEGERWGAALLEHLTRLDADEGQSLLHWAALYNEHRILALCVDALRQHAAAVDDDALATALGAKNRKAASLLHQAVLGGAHHVMRSLLALGVDVEPRNRWQETPLHLAAQTGDALAVLLLLAAGAAVDPVDQWGRAAAQIADEHGEPSLSRLFAADAAARRRFADACLWQLDHTACPSVHEAVRRVVGASSSQLPPSRQQPAAAILSKMLEAPLDEDWLLGLLRRSDPARVPVDDAEHYPLDLLAPDMWGLRPVHKLAAWERPAALRALLAHPQLAALAASPDQVPAALLTSKRETPLHLAVEHGALACADHLLRHYPCMAVAAAADRSTPLLLAAPLAASGTSLDAAAAFRLVERLLAAGADPLLPNDQQQSPAHVVLQLHHSSPTPDTQRAVDLLRAAADPPAWSAVEDAVRAAVEEQRAAAERRKNASARRALDQKKFGAIRHALSGPPPPPPPSSQSSS